MQKHLGWDQVRVTFRVPRHLLEEFTKAMRPFRTYGGPSDSDLVRLALEHCLTCSHLRHDAIATIATAFDATNDPERHALALRNWPPPGYNPAPEDAVPVTVDETASTTVVSEELYPSELDRVPDRHGDQEPLPVSQYLGKLCPQGHEQGQTGKSALYRIGKNCVVCHQTRKRAKRQTERDAKRQTQAV